LRHPDLAAGDWNAGYPASLPIYELEAVAVNLILEAISTSVSALPTAASVGQTVSGQHVQGGFGLALAAAQGLPIPAQTSTSQTGVGEVEASGGPAAEGSGVAANLNVRMPASENFQLKKWLSNFPVPLSAPAPVNIVVAGFTPAAAGQIPLSPPQVSVTQPNAMQPNPPQPNLPLTPAIVPTLVQKVAAGTIHTGLQTGANDATTSEALVSYSAPSPTTGSFGSLTSPDSTAGTATNPAAPAVLIPNVSSQTNGQQTATADLAPAPLSTAAGASALPEVVPNPDPRSQENISPDVRGFTGPILTETTPLPALSTTSEQAVSDKVLPSTAPGGQWDGEYGKGAAEPLLAENILPPALSVTAELTVQANPPVESTATPTLLANANVELVTAASVPFLSSEKVQVGEADSGNAAAPESAVQGNVSAQIGTNPISGIIDAQTAALSALNAPAQPASGSSALRLATPWFAPRVTDAGTTPNVREAGQGAGAPAPMLASVLSTEDSGKGLPVASQTPFSIFFSGPGPGTESASSALPKMILPVASSAIRDGHSASQDLSSASPQASSWQSGMAHNAVLQNGNSNTKDLSSGTSSGNGSGSSAGAQPVRRDGELNAVGAQFAAAQAAAAAAPAPAPPTSAGVTLSVGEPTALAADALPKAEAPPAAPSGPASAALATPETPAAAAPGPVQLAQIVNRVEQSEMRIGMNTSAFGSVEVRAVVHANDVGLVVGSERGDLRSLLSNDLPALANTLQEQNLRLHSVNFMQGFAFSNNASGGGDSQPRSFVPMRASSNSALSDAAAEDSTELLPAGEFGGSSLSILA
jgi:hypothetical protein